MQFPFVCPTKLRNLCDKFNLRALLEANLSEYKTKKSTISTASIISKTDQRLFNVQSQVPGVSRLSDQGGRLPLRRNSFQISNQSSLPLQTSSQDRAAPPPKLPVCKIHLNQDKEMPGKV